MNITQRSFQTPIFKNFFKRQCSEIPKSTPRFNKEKPKPDLRIFGALGALIITIVAVKLAGSGNSQPPQKMLKDTPKK